MPGRSSSTNKFTLTLKITVFGLLLTAVVTVISWFVIPAAEHLVIQWLATRTPTPTATIAPTSTAILPTQTATLPVQSPTQIPSITASPIAKMPAVLSAPTTSPLYVYKDANFDQNHYIFSGVMGDIGDIKVNESTIVDPTKPSETIIQVIYSPDGKGDPDGNHSCSLGIVKKTMCTWAGAYWLSPPDNFGTVELSGYNLTAYSYLKFRARSENTQVNVKFLVGGIGWASPTPVPFPDSIKDPATTGWAALTPGWKEFTIDISAVDRSHVIGGFGFTINWTNSGLTQGGKAVTFYIDDIRFEK